MARKLNKALADEFADAFKARPALLPSRAGRHNNYFEIYADNKQLRHMDTKNWQILYGRRGTGKTTLLGTFSQYIERNYSEKNSACLRVNMLECLSVVHNLSDPDREFDDDDRARTYFSSFMAKIGYELFDYYVNENKNKILYRLSISSPRKSAIFDKVLEITAKCSFGMPAYELSDMSEKSTFLEMARKRGVIEASGNFSIQLDGGDASAGLSTEASAEIEKSETTERNIDIVYKLDFGSIKTDILELLDLLEIDTLYLLIDEWSEIDKGVNTNIQAIFSEFLKRTFGGTGRFCVKMAAVRPQTKLLGQRNKIDVGLEQGADIFPIDLDVLYGGGGRDIDLVVFFETLLYKHLSFCNSELKKFHAREENTSIEGLEGRPNEQFIGFIFQNQKVLREAMKGAGNIPRDFIEIVDRIASNTGYDFSKPWKHSQVRSAIHTLCIQNKEENIDNEPCSIGLFKRLINKLETTRQRLILVPKNWDKNERELIGSFYLKRILHDVSLIKVPAKIRAEFDAYYIDYGLLLDVLKNSEGEFGTIAEECPLIEEIENDRYLRHVLAV